MLQFIKQFIFHPLKTGAIAPTGDDLAELITDLADLKNTDAVVEFGCGSGVFTEKILKKISPRAKFFALEINPDFVEATKERCPNAVVYNDSAQNIEKHLKQNGLNSCDVIISGLPWAMFGEETRMEILDAISGSLKPGGKFLTFSYVHGSFIPTGINFKKQLDAYFSKVEKSDTILNNIPPAFVYSCIK